jgi:hypothetical protein
LFKDQIAFAVKHGDLLRREPLPRFCRLGGRGIHDYWEWISLIKYLAYVNLMGASRLARG